jgi:thioesterase domain-containing protein
VLIEHAAYKRTMSDAPNQTTDLSPKQQKELLAELLSRKSSQLFPLSLAQQRLWFLDQLEPGNPAYNVPFGLRLRGKLNLDALRSSVQEVVRRHEILRTTFRLEGANPVQVVAADSVIEIPVLDLTAMPSGNRESGAYQIASAEARIPFDLQAGPLLRLKLIRLSAEEHILVCVMHHIVCDGWSLGILKRELAALYAHHGSGQSSSLAGLPIQYGDYAEWQQNQLAGDFLADQIQYWKQRLAGMAGYLELPADRVRPPEQTYDGASQATAVPTKLIRDLTVLGRTRQATLFMVMVAAFKVLLHSYSTAQDILVGVPVAGRNRVELEDLIGFFVNTIVLRTDLSGDPQFTDLLLEAREVTLGAFAHVDVPFEKLVEELNPPRTLSYNPVFQVMFSAIKAGRLPQFGDVVASSYVITTGTSAFDLSMDFIEDADDRWWLNVEYNTTLFDYVRAARMLRDYLTLLGAIATQPELRLSELVALLEAEGDTNSHISAGAHGNTHGTALSEARGGSSRGRDESEPRDALEQILLRIWKRVLGVSKVGIYDDFFDLGGHSLLAAHLMSEVQKAVGRKIPVAVLFRSSTIDSFAEAIRQGTEWTPDPLLMEIQGGSREPPIFAVAAPGVDTLGYALLARHIGAEQPFYKLQAYAPMSSLLPYTIEELRTMAREYIGAMRAIQPEGPYFLIGACGGVHIAEQMVLELEADGRDVGLLVLIDTWVLQNRQIRWLARIDYFYRRLRYLSQMPLPAQLSSYRAGIAKHLRRLVGRETEPPSPWVKAYWPGKDFRPWQFQARILLFRRPRQPYFYVKDPEMGWGARSTGGVEICLVDAAHEEMLREPAVRIIAEKLRETLPCLKGRNSENTRIGGNAITIVA